MYIRITGVGAIYIEVSTLLGAKPLYNFNKWDKETIVDLPWMQIILTPWSVIEREDRIIHGTKINGQVVLDPRMGSPHIPCPSAPVAKDRFGISDSIRNLPVRNLPE